MNDEKIRKRLIWLREQRDWTQKQPYDAENAHSPGPQALTGRTEPLQRPISRGFLRTVLSFSEQLARRLGSSGVRYAHAITT